MIADEAKIKPGDKAKIKPGDNDKGPDEGEEGLEMARLWNQLL